MNGLRHPFENGTCGWYIWCGEDLPEDPEFFDSMHVSHISEYLPSIEKYLALPVGYRFLVTETYEDIWYDETLKNV
ncbi:immunity protein Imm33 domain-containing protein [Cocleimonas flava]|uniref:immunity protein Imm33 domain-containing protein n=1 Tax=Cocleimonas flava TaxID=634765 RepID=UPI003C777DEC